MDTDYYGMGYGDEPTPEERAQAIAAALQKRQLGTLGVLSGVDNIAAAGQGLIHQADAGDSMLLKAGENKLLRETEANRWNGMNQWRESESERKAAKDARPEFTNPTQGVDGQSFVVNKRDPNDVQVVHTAAKLLKTGKGGASGVATPIDPGLLDHYAKELNAGHDYPMSAKGKAGRPLASAIEARALALDPSASAAAARAGFHADTASLAEGVKQADVTDVAEGKALGDIGILETQMRGVVDTKSPFFNKPFRELQEKSGDPKVAAFLTARVAAVAQINKVINSGTLTESARKEAEDLLKPDATMAQMVAVLGVLKQDMARSKTAMHERVSNVSGRMSGRPPVETVNAATAPVGASEVVMLDPKGVPHAVPVNQVDAATAHGWKKRG